MTKIHIYDLETPIFDYFCLENENFWLENPIFTISTESFYLKPPETIIFTLVRHIFFLLKLKTQV